ncbi:hypothetical protein [Microbacterium sp. 18062]|uniref:hypothetical protein n=1 Tax=Microbacterium sp. 18062 TaxID=2681410 RepID=UPI00135BABDC|nr:hypothetical protein [Microbacterium sp. 18062]
MLSPAPSPVPLFLSAEAMITRVRLHDDRRYVRVRSGVYAPRDAWLSLKPWQRYLARVHAFALQHPSAALAYESAAALHRLPLFGEPRDIHVFDTERTRSRRFGDVCVHTSRDEREVIAADGMLLTSLLDTGIDLMRVLPPAFALAVGDAATASARADATTVAEMRVRASAGIGTRGRRQMAALLPLVEPATESVGESVSRAVIIWLGFEAPEVQVSFFDGAHEDRVDFFWRQVRAIGESDGYGKYAGDTVDATVSRMVHEKRREDRLRRSCDSFMRWDWSDAMAVDPLEGRLMRARVPRIAAPHAAYLATLRHNPRSR